MKKMLSLFVLAACLIFRVGIAYSQDNEGSYPSPDVSSEPTEAQAEVQGMENSMATQPSDVGGGE